MKPPNQKGFAAIIIILLVILLVGGVGAIGYKYLKTTKSTKSNLPNSISITPTPFPINNSEKQAGVRIEVIYPGAQFEKKEDVPPCTTEGAQCVGSLGPSGGFRYTYKVQVPLHNVWSWYTEKWGLSGGGGGSIDKVNDKREPLVADMPFGRILDKNTNKNLYFVDISGDEFNTTIVFSTNDQTSN